MKGTQDDVKQRIATLINNLFIFSCQIANMNILMINCPNKPLVRNGKMREVSFRKQTEFNIFRISKIFTAANLFQIFFI